MKILSIRYAVLLALAGAALLCSTAQAVNDYDPGDLLLGVRAAGNPGATQDIIVNLGPVTQFVETNNATIPVGPNVKTALSAIYGSNWANRADIFWSVSGSTQGNSVGGFGPKTLLATRARLNFATPATPWDRFGDTAQGFTSSKMGSLATKYNNGPLVSGVLTEGSADANSYSSFMPGPNGTAPNSGGVSFASFAPTIEGTPGQALDLFRMETGSGPGVYVGRFTLYSSGKVVFTPRDGEGAAFTSVQFEQAAYDVGINAGTVPVKITRNGDPLVAFDVTANTADGAAIDGTHYTGLTTDQVFSFAANEGEKNLNIPIINLAGSQPPRDFEVEISNPTAGVALGTPTTTTVTIAESGPTQFILGQASYSFDEDTAGTVQIHVKRIGTSTGTNSVQITGTAGTATAPDFTIATQTVTFNPGSVNNDQTVNLVIVADATVESNETFTLKLQVPNGGTLGVPSSAPVTILDASGDTDTTAPGAPTISTPIATPVQNVGVATGGTTNIFGSATDNKGVQFVEFRIITPGGQPSTFTSAVLGTPGGTTTTFTAPVIPVTGTNTVEVRSKDFRLAPGPNTSTVTTRTFFVARPLQVNVEGTGTLTTGFQGTSFREVGKSLTITATPATTPAPGSIFAGWEIMSGHTFQQLGIASNALDKQTLTLIFREGLILKAKFGTNPYVNLAGKYNGLIRGSATLPNRNPTATVGPEDGTPPNNSSDGFFTATITNNGGFSGTITIDGFALSVAGSFDSLGHARFGTSRALSVNVPRANKPSLEANFDITLASPFKITGKVTATDFKKSNLPTGVSLVDADRAHYTGTTALLTVPDAYLTVNGATKSDAKFTMLFPPKAVGVQPPGYTVADFPQSEGVGSVTISKAGLVTIAGTLADGTPVSQSTALSQGNTFPLFVQLYNKLGFVGGMVTLNSADADSDMKALTDLLWCRPLLTTQQWYPAGWADTLKLGMKAAKYLNPSGISVLRKANYAGLGAIDADGNADLHFTGGLLTASMDRLVSVTTTNAVTKVPDNDPTYTIVITPATGMVNGVFDHEDDTKPTYQAAIYQKGLNAGAFGFFLTVKPLVIDYTGEAGRVVLTGQ